MSSSPGSEDEIFEHALHLSGEARAGYLESACGGDAQLRQRIESLLEADERAGTTFLNGPAVVSSKTLRVTPAVISVTERPGDKIGRYKLLEQIGEGGCGVVYVAEQQEPVRRRVALKVIKLGMDTKQVVARFEAERQALALMDHPHIAKVLDAGATETGRPFFVMELVRGIKITDYCDKHNLSTEERLKLVIQVCSAIQHAHQKGIIHRDIKPSNILVTSHDGVPVPKVIDFGIAKATTDQRLTDKTIYTAFEQFIGTPAYMSPEQAEMSGLDIDTRSDIYSLGVLLYELLTSRTPFDTAALLKAGLDQMRRIIREQEPQRPSTRLSTLDAAHLKSVAQQRGSEAPKLVNLIRGDLDWIVMKSLEKDRTRRYSTVNALAMDLQRHLGNEPVVARPPSPIYRLQKFVRRNTVAVAATGLALLAAAAALIVGMRISQGSSAPRQAFLPSPTSTATNTGAASPQPAPEPRRLVSGVLLAGDTGRPLTNALVRVAAPSTDMRFVRRDTPDIYEGRTDAEGRFKIPTPPKATIALDAFYPGYESVSGTLMQGSPFHLFDLPFPADHPQKFTIKLAPSLYVAGVVVDEDGQALSNVEVGATMERKDGMGMANVKYAQTDAKGRFEIFDFPLKPRVESRGQLTFESPAMLRSVIDDVYPLNETQRASIRIILRRGHDIKGVVTSAGGRPAAHTLVEAIPSDPAAQFKEAATDADGRFVLQGLPDGDILVRTHSLALEQKAQAAVHLTGADVVTDLRLEPIILKNPLSLVPLFGMKLADITPEIKIAYDLGVAAQGVLIVNPGQNSQRLGIGTLEEGEYFCMVGSKVIANLREMVTELLRISQIKPSLLGSLLGRQQEGHRGFIRIVYSSQHWSNTQYIKLTDEDVAELKKLAETLGDKRAGK
jgi:serine/threonine protein kinase